MDGAGGNDWGPKVGAGVSPASSTPAWLKGGYAPRAAGAGVGPVPHGKALGGPAPAAKPAPSQVQLNETWCKNRRESIEKTIEGGNSVTELRGVLDFLRVPQSEKHLELVGSIRKEKWAAKERMRKATADLHKLQQEMIRLDFKSDNVDAKLARLHANYRFIENGWQNPPVETVGNNDAT